MCIKCVADTHVIHLYFHTCNIPKTPHMYYRCSTNGHVVLINIACERFRVEKYLNVNVYLSFYAQL